MKARARPGTKNRVAAPPYSLRLYVTGMTQRSLEAVANIRQICEEHLRGHHTLEIVDVYDNAERAMRDQIVASPTLIKLSPAPQRRFVGNLSDRNRVLLGLELPLNGDMDDSEITATAQK